MGRKSTLNVCDKVDILTVLSHMGGSLYAFTVCKCGVMIVIYYFVQQYHYSIDNRVNVI